MDLLFPLATTRTGERKVQPRAKAQERHGPITLGNRLTQRNHDNVTPFAGPVTAKSQSPRKIRSKLRAGRLDRLATRRKSSPVDTPRASRALAQRRPIAVVKCRAVQDRQVPWGTGTYRPLSLVPLLRLQLHQHHLCHHLLPSPQIRSAFLSGCQTRPFISGPRDLRAQHPQAPGLVPSCLVFAFFYLFVLSLLGQSPAHHSNQHRIVRSGTA